MTSRTLSIVVFLLVVGCMGVPQTKNPNVSSTKRVSLENVLSCANDPLFQTLFDLDDDDLSKLTQGTASYDAGFSHSRGFQLQHPPNDDKVWAVVFRHPESSFCRSHVLLVPSPKPLYIDVGVGFDSSAMLNPNEVFEHADQFTFRSGTFTDSTEVYLNVCKGNIFMQFVFRNGALRLSRVTYMNPNSEAAKLLVKHWMDQNDR